MLRSLLFISAFIAGVSLSAQQFTLSGNVVDPDEKPLAFANILIHQDTTFVKAGLSEQDGSFSFSLPAGKYEVTTSFLGYADRIDTIDLSKDIHLGVVHLSTEGVNLDQIIVTELKNELSAGIDKKVVYVTDALKSATTNLSEIMEMVPLISMDMDGTPQIPGKQGVVVLVNGREPRVRANDLATVLRLIPASQILKIEIMTNPPAKYTKTNAAVINVVTNQALQDGYLLNGWGNGNILGAVGGGGNLTVKRGKFSVSSWGGRWAYRSESEETSAQTNLLATDNFLINSESKSKYNSGGFYGGIAPEYQFNEKNYLSLYGGLYRWGNESEELADVEVVNNEGQLNRNFGRNNFFGNDGMGVFAGLEYFKYFDEPEKELSFDFGYDRSQRTNDSESFITNEADFYQENETGRTETTIDFSAQFFDPIDSTSSINYAFEAERTLPFRETSEFFTGPNPSELTFQDELSYINELENFTQEFSVSYAKRFGKTNITLDVGQFFQRIDYFYDLQERLERDFLFVIPKMNITQKIGEKNEIGISYKYSAEAPYQWHLNPNLFISSDGLSQRSGNPNLDPERSHEVEANYGFYLGKFNIGTTAFWRYSDNAIQGFTIVNNQGIRLNTYANNGRFVRSGIQLTASGAIQKTLNLNVSGSIFDSRILRNELPTLQTVGFNINGTARYRLPKNFMVNLSAQYRGPELNIQGERSAYYGVRASVRKGFLDNAINVTLFFNDLFRTNRYQNTRSDETFLFESETIDLPPYVGLRVNFKLGELKERPKSNRAGQSGG